MVACGLVTWHEGINILAFTCIYTINILFVGCTDKLQSKIERKKNKLCVFTFMVDKVFL